MGQTRGMDSSTMSQLNSNNNDSFIQEKRIEGENSTGDAASYEVDWSDNDPDNPRNWTHCRKICIIGLVSFVSFLTPLASSMFAPGVPDVMNDFGTSFNILATFVVSVYILGFAFGPLVIAPVCETLGRSPVYHTCNGLFLIFTICNAISTNTPMLIAFRFLAGLAGVGATTIGSGTIADMIPQERRGLLHVFVVHGPYMWSYCRSYSRRFPRRRCGLEMDLLVYRDRDLPKSQIWRQSFIRPMRILLFSPIASSMCAYIAVLYGLLYILFTTISFVFKDQYGLSTTGAGLSFLGSGVGTLLGLFYAGSLSDRQVRLKIAAQEKPQPEDRLPLYMVLPGSLAIPVGLFIYGWTAEHRVHWIWPQIGTAITGFGMILVLFCIQTYLVDTYNTHAASAVAANAVLRSLAGALLPLCGLEVYDRLGLGWGNTLLGFIALILAPIPVLFAVFGERLRKRQGLLV